MKPDTLKPEPTFHKYPLDSTTDKRGKELFLHSPTNSLSALPQGSSFQSGYVHRLYTTMPCSKGIHGLKTRKGTTPLYESGSLVKEVESVNRGRTESLLSLCMLVFT